MKLKHYVTTFLIIFQIYQLSGQDFAPTGAKWYYSEHFAFSGDISHLWIESVGDTIIKGKDCKILENNGAFMCTFHNDKNFVYSEDSAAYFYVPEIDTFQVLYNLRTQKDSSWTIVFAINLSSKLDTMQVTVDSISYITINSKKLKKLYVSYKSLNSGWENRRYEGEIIEIIGDKTHLFNLHSLSGITCDGNHSGGLRCYQDSKLGFYSTGIADSCDYTYKWTGTESNNPATEFRIYPNPTSDWIEFESTTNEELKISILDLSGKIVYEYELLGSSRLDLTKLQKGFYILKIKNSDKILDIRKIIKN